MRFNHIFIPLMFAAGVAAFILPPQAGQGVRLRISSIFAPVASPVRQFAGAIAVHWGESASSSVVDGRPAALTNEMDRGETLRLRNQVASLTMQLDVISEQIAARELRGDAQKYAAPYKVVFADIS